RSMSDEASMYVGTHADMLIQSTAKSRARQVRRSEGTGARSGLMYSEAATSGGSVLTSLALTSAAVLVVRAGSFIVKPFFGPDAPTASAPFCILPTKRRLFLPSPRAGEESG